MRQILFSIGNIHIYGYGVMIAVGFIMGCLLLWKLAKRYGQDPDLAVSLTLVCLISGVIGAKVLFWITVLPDFISRPLYYLRDPANGFVIYGGLIVALIFGIIFLRAKKQNAPAYLDLAVAAVALGQGFGRIGCFLAGCCYGAETSGRFCVVFPENGHSPTGVPLIPTQLIMSGLDFLHCIGLCLFLAKAKNRSDGQTLGLYFICYSIGRFLIEFVRGDAERGHVGPLSTSQFIAIFMLAFGLIMFFGAKKFFGRHSAAAVEAEEGSSED